MSDMINRPKDNGQPVNTETPGVEKPWFFVGLLPSGMIIRENTDSVSGFRSSLDNVTIGWVDYIISGDFARESLTTALQLGFSNELVSQLTAEPRNTYLDNETEVGMKMPSIQVR